MPWNDWLLSVRALLFRSRVEDELDEEVQFHMVMETRKNVLAGMAAPEAGRNARIQFGGLQQAKEQCRDARRVSWIETLIRDVRYGFRGFRRSPGFTITVIVTIALALGLNTTVFTIFNAYVLRPIAVHDPYSLYQFTWTNRNGEGHEFTWQELEAFRRQPAAFSEVLGFRALNVRAEGHALFGHLVTANYFRMVGVDAALGRTLVPQDTGPVVVLSSTAWKKKFGGDPHIIGKIIDVRGHALQVIGVARAEFAGMGPVPLDFWAPLTPDAQSIRIVGRLRNGMHLRQAEAELAAWSQRTTADLPAAARANGVALRSQATTITLEPDLIVALAPLFVAFGLVLLIACANVANMMLARAMARRREIGIRLTIGASRTRLIGQLLTESILLALVAAVAGFGICMATMKLCERLVFATIPASYAEFIMLLPLQPDARVFGFMLAAAVVAAVLFGLAPALQATRTNTLQAPARLRSALLVAQVTVSVLFLISAIMLLRGNHRLQNLDLGLNTHQIIAMEVQDQTRSKVMRQVGLEPAVQIVAGCSKVPLMGYLASTPVAAGDESAPVRAGYLYASPEYFSVFGIPIVKGRAFDAAEARAAAPVVVVSQATARRLWPAGNALGRSLRIISGRKTNDLAQYRTGPPAYNVDRSSIYFPTIADAPGNILLVRVTGDTASVRRKLDRAVDQIHTMDEIRAGQLYPFRALYWLSSAVGGLALILTLSGLYGVLSYLVSQRTKEIGIRVALGASTAGVVGMVLKQSLRFTLMGTVLGVAGAIAVSRLLASQVGSFVFERADGAAFALGALLVLAASVCAAYVPCLRAARIEPMITLRYD